MKINDKFKSDSNLIEIRKRYIFSSKYRLGNGYLTKAFLAKRYILNFLKRKVNY
jgi:hypothetical protein